MSTTWQHPTSSTHLHESIPISYKHRLFFVYTLYTLYAYPSSLQTEIENKNHSIERRKGKMQSAKQKVSNMASAAKEHLDIAKAQTQEKMEMAAARTKEEREIAEERRKVKEAEAKMRLHESKADHAAKKLHSKEKYSSHLPGGHAPAGVYGHTQPHVGGTGTVVPPPPQTGTVPAVYPPTGTHTGRKFL